MHLRGRERDAGASRRPTACGVQVDPPGIEGVAGAHERRERVVDDGVLEVEFVQPLVPSWAPAEARHCARSPRSPLEDRQSSRARGGVVLVHDGERHEPPDQRQSRDEEGDLAQRQGSVGAHAEEQDGARDDGDQHEQQLDVALPAARQRQLRVPGHRDGVDLVLGCLSLPTGSEQHPPGMVRERAVEVHGRAEEAGDALVDLPQAKLVQCRHARLPSTRRSRQLWARSVTGPAPSRPRAVSVAVRGGSGTLSPWECGPGSRAGRSTAR